MLYTENEEEDVGSGSLYNFNRKCLLQAVCKGIVYVFLSIIILYINQCRWKWTDLFTDVFSVMAEEEDETGFEEEADEGPGGVDICHGRRKRLFSKELRCMMYGFGDDQNPYTESVDILEDLVIEFITEMTHKAMSIGRQGRVQVEDIVFLIRKDPRKFARVKDLLTMNEELKRARKAFDEANYGS